MRKTVLKILLFLLSLSFCLYAEKAQILLFKSPGYTDSWSNSSSTSTNQPVTGVKFKITNNDNIAYDNMQVLIKTSSNELNCNDKSLIGVYNESDQSLPYWIEKWSSSTVFLWTKISHIDANSNVTIKVSCSDASKQSPSPENVFVFFDDFDNVNTSDWKIYTHYNSRYYLSDSKIYLCCSKNTSTSDASEVLLTSKLTTISLKNRGFGYHYVANDSAPDANANHIAEYSYYNSNDSVGSSIKLFLSYAYNGGFYSIFVEDPSAHELYGYQDEGIVHISNPSSSTTLKLYAYHTSLGVKELSTTSSGLSSNTFDFGHTYFRVVCGDPKIPEYQFGIDYYFIFNIPNTDFTINKL